MKNMRQIPITVEPEFDEVLEKIDAIAKERDSSRSAVIREILYQQFNIVAPKTLSRSSISRISKKDD
jgi:Ribbon-helix-helix protein, copG family.